MKRIVAESFGRIFFFPAGSGPTTSPRGGCESASVFRCSRDLVAPFLFFPLNINISRRRRPLLAAWEALLRWTFIGRCRLRSGNKTGRGPHQSVKWPLPISKKLHPRPVPSRFLFFSSSDTSFCDRRSCRKQTERMDSPAASRVAAGRRPHGCASLRRRWKMRSVRLTRRPVKDEYKKTADSFFWKKSLISSHCLRFLSLTASQKPQKPRNSGFLPQVGMKTYSFRQIIDRYVLDAVPTTGRRLRCRTWPATAVCASNRRATSPISAIWASSTPCCTAGNRNSSNNFRYRIYSYSHTSLG